ncbi:unnamed protein product [Protopolystoma xenopodis]|uniref:Uncharacterized protein n=1 Tax=Protopolystoma xenopodis TaxID=117903 RepID=A0A448WAP6_9PLAT|nr:unnamed protein product [Protopolystoma xenopodis]
MCSDGVLATATSARLSHCRDTSALSCLVSVIRQRLLREAKRGNLKIIDKPNFSSDHTSTSVSVRLDNYFLFKRQLVATTASEAVISRARYQSARPIHEFPSCLEGQKAKSSYPPPNCVNRSCLTSLYNNGDPSNCCHGPRFFDTNFFLTCQRANLHAWVRASDPDRPKVPEHKVGVDPFFPDWHILAQVQQ